MFVMLIRIKKCIYYARDENIDGVYGMTAVVIVTDQNKDSHFWIPAWGYDLLEGMILDLSAAVCASSMM